MKTPSQLWYSLRTRNHFSPIPLTVLYEDDLEKILSGELKNPRRTRFNESVADYGFFIMSADSYGFGDEVISGPLLFDVKHVRAVDNSDWFGYVMSESSSSFVFPKLKEEVIFDPKSWNLAQVPLHQSVWEGGGRYQLDKLLNAQVLVTTIKAEQVRERLSCYFPLIRK